MIESSKNRSSVIGRLAPSPTGKQHLGNARTFLIAWLSARSRNGIIHLRIEDIDSPRIVAGGTELLVQELTWLGLDWDGPIVVQSERLNLYEQALLSLQQKELVYPCTCSRSDILHAASAPHLEHEAPPYPGICAHRFVRDATDLRDCPFSWRLRTEPFQDFYDSFLGPVKTSELGYGGDFVIWKNSKTPSYQLAVVVDDAAMGINEVIRGDDLIPSTPRQLRLFDLLQLPAPKYCHVPLVKGIDGKRLAKRHGDIQLDLFRKEKISAEFLLGFLAWSLGWLAKASPISARELLSCYNLHTIPKDPFVIQPNWMEDLKNGKYPARCHETYEAGLS